MRPRLAWAAALALGCGGDSAGDASSESESTGTAAITVSGEIVRSDPIAMMETPEAGVEVCASHLDPPACDTTNAEGNFGLGGIVPGSEIRVSARKSGLYGAVQHGIAPEEDIFYGGIFMLPDPTIAMIYAIGEIDQRPGNGTVVFELQGEVEGFTASVNPDPGADVVYSAALGLPDPTLAMTGLDGGGAVANLPPGEYELAFQREGSICVYITGNRGWPTATGEGVRFTIEADTLTGPVQVTCN